MMPRSILCFCLIAPLTCIHGAAQFLEPILTKTALPNSAGTVSAKLDFVTPPGGTGASTQALPEARFELGLGRGFDTVLQMPLLRVSEPDGSSVLTGGQFSIALRYLLAGSPSGKYAVSLWGRLEVPTGNSTVVGNTTQLMPMVLVEWHPLSQLRFYSNIAWNTVVSGSTQRFANFEHSNAVLWLASRHFMPSLEVVGSTDTRNGGSQVVIQPEVIVLATQHIELKTGLSVALIPTPHYAIRSQLAWFWGKRR
jgi:hypothetical protein